MGTASWGDADKVDEYLGRVGTLAPRLAGEAALLEVIPPRVVSGFAIHHLDDDRKRTLFAEITRRLDPGACSRTWRSSPRRHRDPLRWMRDAGLVGRAPERG